MTGAIVNPPDILARTMIGVRTMHDLENPPTTQPSDERMNALRDGLTTQLTEDAARRPALGRWAADLRPAIVASLKPRHGRLAAPRRPFAGGLRAVAVAVGLVLATVIGVSQVYDGGNSPALAVTSGPQFIELRIADASASADEMTRDLRAAGINGEVRVIPVSTDLAGHWVMVSVGPRAGARETGSGLSSARASARDVTEVNGIELNDTTLRIPVARVKASSGPFVFYAGRTTEPGEKKETLLAPQRSAPSTGSHSDGS